jgi:membrane protein implicated in regulation of membrane protease activity
MPWWGWLILGLVLLGLELGLIDAAFYLVFIGLSAIIVGLLEMAGLGLPLWGEWVLFAVLSVTTMVFFRKRLYTVVRGTTKEIDQPLIGKSITVPQTLGPGARCRAEHQGSTWTVKNIGQGTIGAGSDAPIVDVDGLTLTVRSDQG